MGTALAPFGGMTWLTTDGRWKRLLGWSAVAVLPGGVLLLPLMVATRKPR